MKVFGSICFFIFWVTFSAIVGFYFFPLHRPVRLYSAISLDTCDLEYHATFCTYRRIAPFSDLLRR